MARGAACGRQAGAMRPEGSTQRPAVGPSAAKPPRRPLSAGSPGQPWWDLAATSEIQAAGLKRQMAAAAPA